ncbi:MULTISPECIES: DUF6912 family protein [Nocardioides]|uniref:Uncharacterized protein n=1 Tax=Nocardioides lianchengensis TaxID=1045774 RepID=A0A1G6UW32_9ACTN|nr:hypothetical protein [Nocardioides lianchengensis]NYG11038.1 hypothetical protein [Nocardioides lianchengensis]SDD44857.1 hypothetical protein SAMN05421872_10891 [Nocardioides lianchengensis]
MSTRVYVPTTLAGLASYVAAGEVPASAERFVAPDESEEGEYAALVAAGEAAAELLDGPGRRVVVVGEAADPDAAVAWRQVVAVHADALEGADPDDDLAWFATQEVPHLLDGSAF